MKKLKNETQKYMKLNFNQYEGIKARRFVNKEDIAYEQFTSLKIILNVKDYTLIRMLGISVYSYKLINNSKKGFWTGSDTKIPRDFTDANQFKLGSRLKKSQIKYLLLLALKILNLKIII